VSPDVSNPDADQLLTETTFRTSARLETQFLGKIGPV
jgi:hypothetical protein